jgi:hypothetical protein
MQDKEFPDNTTTVIKLYKGYGIAEEGFDAIMEEVTAALEDESKTNFNLPAEICHRLVPQKILYGTYLKPALQQRAKEGSALYSYKKHRVHFLQDLQQTIARKLKVSFSPFT